MKTSLHEVSMHWNSWAFLLHNFFMYCKCTQLSDIFFRFQFSYYFMHELDLINPIFLQKNQFVSITYSSREKRTILFNLLLDPVDLFFFFS